tara:strand:+ start:51 stop:521 length:471 start_codon:yes stop_codon:yes gene_type:complete
MNQKCSCGYRLVAPRWVDSAFSGEGARKYGGRWNSPGLPMVYLGGSRALTALELLVHLTTPTSRSKPFCLMEVKIPKHLISDYPTEILAEDWRNHPPGEHTLEIGDDWLKAGGQLALRVPSIIIPEETNILLNPLHPKFSKIEVSTTQNFNFDPRL